ncbi:hypothetical protein, conserved [Trypanosoma vivax Y486]|uniref:Retrotransposon hot spot protein (RHS) n=1 Tax=Trypanosoma vivax (strain Y486) TaxID=1055687 RepID=F9WLW8_TRYVY|nr:hypothetical protein, conserved [Trypanosoma vivax Y486]|eukprot:CCD18512.1 hypothetical protein, conserved [Trypanosoma vivax Y486]
MKRSAKGAEAMNEAVARGIRMATKRTIPKGKGVAPPFWTPVLTKLDKMAQECENERKRDALIRWRRKLLGDKVMGRWKENVAKLSATDSASWNLVKSICAPRPLTSPVLVVDGHPLTKRQQAPQALAQMCMAMSTNAPHAPEIKIPSSRRNTFNPSPRQSWTLRCVSCRLARRRVTMRYTVRSLNRWAKQQSCVCFVCYAAHCARGRCRPSEGTAS